MKWLLFISICKGTEWNTGPFYFNDRSLFLFKMYFNFIHHSLITLHSLTAPVYFPKYFTPVWNKLFYTCFALSKIREKQKVGFWIHNISKKSFFQNWVKNQRAEFILNLQPTHINFNADVQKKVETFLSAPKFFFCFKRLDFPELILPECRGTRRSRGRARSRRGLEGGATRGATRRRRTWRACSRSKSPLSLPRTARWRKLLKGKNNCCSDKLFQRNYLFSIVIPLLIYQQVISKKRKHLN